MPHALIVEDDRCHRASLCALVEGEGFRSSQVESLAGARRALGSHDFDLLLSDIRLPDGCALGLLSDLEQHPATRLVFVTGHASVVSAVDAFRQGAADYLTKPVDVERLREILVAVRSASEQRSGLLALRDEERGLARFGRMVGASASMRRAYEQILKVAPTDATVLVVGETGTGKELVAQAVHGLSRRAEEPFVAVNCGAISASLIESELFGHEKGSFTGAARRHAGVFERAHGGTLFLDEVTEMPLELQVRLLRTLEVRQVQRVGGERPIDVDVRLVAATNRDPHRAVSEGRLRQDLLYRLLVFEIALPPLRERDDDIGLLAEHALAGLNRRAGTRKQLTPAARERLRGHAWPGNVRELVHVMERAFILAEDEIDVGHLAFGAGGNARQHPDADGDVESLGVRVGMSTAEAARILTLATLHRYREKKRTAEVLGISLKTLYNRLKAYEAGPDSRSESSLASSCEARLSTSMPWSGGSSS